MSNIDGGQSSTESEKASQHQLEQRYSSLLQRQIVRQVAKLILVVVVAYATYRGLKFVGFFDKTFQFDSFFGSLSDFFPPNFADLTLRTRQKNITGLKALVETVTHPFSIYKTIISEKVAARTTLVRLSAVTIMVGFTGTVLGFPMALFSVCWAPSV